MLGNIRKINCAAMIFWAFSLSGCVGIGNSKTYPTEIIGEAFSNSCDSISGHYKSAGRGVSNGKYYQSRPILERDISGLEKIASNENSVRLEFLSQDRMIHIVVYNSGGKILASKKLFTTYECKNGWLFTNSFIHGNSGESSVLATHKNLYMSRLKSSALKIVSFREVEYRDWIFFTRSEFFRTEYEFDSMDLLKTDPR